MLSVHSNQNFVVAFLDMWCVYCIYRKVDHKFTAAQSIKYLGAFSVLLFLKFSLLDVPSNTGYINLESIDNKLQLNIPECTPAYAARSHTHILKTQTKFNVIYFYGDVQKTCTKLTCTKGGNN